MTAKEHYVQGLKLIGSGNLAGAAEAFRKSVEVDPGFSMGYLGWSQALDRQGKVEEAITQVRRAIQIDPDDALAYTSLSRLYQQKGMIPEAEEAMSASARLGKAEQD